MLDGCWTTAAASGNDYRTGNKGITVRKLSPLFLIPKFDFGKQADANMAVDDNRTARYPVC